MITITCGSCKKQYKVDPKLGGKKAKCKACGGVIRIPLPEAAEGGDDLMADLSVATAAEKKASGRPASPAAPRPAPRGPAPAKAAAAKKPAAAQPAASDAGEMDFADPPCPKCKRPLPRGDRVCIACGYDKNPKAAASSGAAVRPSRTVGFMKPGPADGVERDYQGMRVNQPYNHAMLNLVDTWTPKLAVFLVFGAVVALLGLMWYMALTSDAASAGRLNYGRLVGVTVGFIVFVAISLLVNLSITGAGVGIGAKIMKCQLPEGVWSRLMATYLVPSLLAMGVIRLMGMGLEGLSGASPTVTIGAIIAALLAALGVFLVTNFFTFLFFFRLKIREGLVTYLFFAMFYVLSCIANGIVFFLISLGLRAMKLV